MRKIPGFSLVVVIMLALGIGGNAAIFTVLDKVLLQSLPVRKPEELNVLSSYYPHEGPDYGNSFSYPMYQDIRDKNEVFSGVIARGGAQMNVSYGDQNERVRADLVSGNYFQVLGVNAWQGALFTQDDDRTPGAHPVAVLSYSFWERRFAKDPSVVGKTILVNEHPLTVIGVTPPRFFGVYLSSSIDVWVPLMMTPVFNPLPPTRLSSRRHQWITVMARRKSGVTIDQAQASLGLLYHQLRESEAQQLPSATSAFDRDQFLARKIGVLAGSQGFASLQREMRLSLPLLFGATVVVLLIMCANLANLIMARATARSQETAVRLALGAGRLRLLRQWLTEGIALSLLGGVAGVLVAVWLKTGLLAFMPRDVRSNLNTPLGWRFFGFLLLVTLIVGVAFSLVPAIQAARQASVPSLRVESRNVTSPAKFLSLRSGLITLQVALSLPLLIGALLFLRTLQNLRSLDTGFSKDNVLLATVNPSLNGYTPDKSRTFYGELLTRIRALPGVLSASLGSDSPISGGWDQSDIVVEGYTPREDERMASDVTYVSPDYFKTLGIAFADGRDFTQQDVLGAPEVAIINEKMARYFFGNSNPIGKRIGLDKVPDITIVGVVKDAKYVTLRESLRRHFYTPVMQEPRLLDLALHVKTTGEPKALIGLVRSEIKAMDPHLPLYNIKTLAEEIDQSLVQDRLVSWLTTAFAVLASLLTALGLYGVLTFSVARRTREIGIRVALGAQRRDVFKLIIGYGVALVSIGTVLGIIASIALTKIVAGLLFGVTATNATVFVLASVVLILLALVACYLPASRAAKVDPMVALRYE
jgi:predicted permease